MDDGEISTALRDKVGSTNVESIWELTEKVCTRGTDEILSGVALLVSCKLDIAEEVSVGVVPCKTLVNVSAKVGVTSTETSLEGPSEDVTSTEVGVGVPSVLRLLLGESSTSERLVVLLTSVPDGVTCGLTLADGVTSTLTVFDGATSILTLLGRVI